MSTQDVLEQAEHTQITNLWVKVITKAIDDLASFVRFLEDDKFLSEEDWENAKSAYCFLFNDGYTIPIDDYDVDIYCPACDDVWVDKMSELAKLLDQKEITCPLCKGTVAVSSLKYREAWDTEIKETSLKDILTAYNLKDLSHFRELAREKMRETVSERRKTLAKRKKR